VTEDIFAGDGVGALHLGATVIALDVNHDRCHTALLRPLHLLHFIIVLSHYATYLTPSFRRKYFVQNF